MTITDTIKTLAAHQKWRTGGPGPQTSPEALTAATLSAIAHLRALERLLRILKNNHIARPGIATCVEKAESAKP